MAPLPFLTDVLGDTKSPALVNDYVLFKSLPALLRSGNKGRLQETVLRMSEALDHIEGARLLQGFSCFLRLSLRRAAFLPGEASGTAPALVGYALMLADCFWEELPESLVLDWEQGEAPTAMLLPRQGCLLPLGRMRGRPMKAFRARLRRLPPRQLYLPVPGHTHGPALFSGRHPLLFEEDYYAELCGLDGGAGPWQALLGSALQLVRKASPAKYTALTRDVEMIVPIRYRQADTHHSFTSMRLPNTVFVSANADAVDMAEALVHEGGHNCLNQVIETRALFSGEADAVLFYSPWRDDPRPLIGLFHAAFVFTEVCTFYVQLLDKGLLGTARLPAARRALSKHYCRLCMALPQLKKRYFTPEGWALVRLISDHVAAVGTVIGGGVGEAMRIERRRRRQALAQMQLVAAQAAGLH